MKLLFSAVALSVCLYSIQAEKVEAKNFEADSGVAIKEDDSKLKTLVAQQHDMALDVKFEDSSAVKVGSIRARRSAASQRQQRQTRQRNKAARRKFRRQQKQNRKVAAQRGRKIRKHRRAIHKLQRQLRNTRG